MSTSPRKKENCHSSGTFFRLRVFTPLPWVWPFFGCFWIFRFLTCMCCKQLSVWHSSHPGQFWPAPASDPRGSLSSGHTIACSALTKVYDPSHMLIWTPNGGRAGRLGRGQLAGSGRAPSQCRSPHEPARCEDGPAPSSLIPSLQPPSDFSPSIFTTCGPRPFLLCSGFFSLPEKYVYVFFIFNSLLLFTCCFYETLHVMEMPHKIM